MSVIAHSHMRAIVPEIFWGMRAIVPKGSPFSFLFSYLSSLIYSLWEARTPLQGDRRSGRTALWLFTPMNRSDGIDPATKS